MANPVDMKFEVTESCDVLVKKGYPVFQARITVVLAEPSRKLPEADRLWIDSVNVPEIRIVGSESELQAFRALPAKLADQVVREFLRIGFDRGVSELKARAL